MKVEIEKYRGFDITFDTEAETFTAWSSAYDNETKAKQSYAATKKYVDDYFKDNEKFKPFFIFKKPGRLDSFIRTQITGKRKDGRLVDINNEQISASYFKNWMIWDETVQDKISEYERLDQLVDDAVENREEYAAIAFANYQSLKEYADTL